MTHTSACASPASGPSAWLGDMPSIQAERVAPEPGIRPSEGARGAPAGEGAPRPGKGGAPQGGVGGQVAAGGENGGPGAPAPMNPAVRACGPACVALRAQGGDTAGPGRPL